MRRKSELILRAALAFALLASAWLKILTGYDPEFSLSPLLYWSITAFEGLLAGLLFTRQRVFAVWCVLLLAAGGMVNAFWFNGGSCGCLGRAVPLDWQGELIAAGALGMLAAAVLSKPMTSHRTT